MDRVTGIERIREAVADSLDLSVEEVKPESRLFTELGADSLDYMELVFTLEKMFDVKLGTDELNSLARLDPEDPEALARIAEWLPEAADLTPPVKPADLWALVRVETLWTAVERQSAC